MISRLNLNLLCTKNPISHENKFLTFLHATYSNTKLEPVTKRYIFELFNPPLHLIRYFCMAYGVPETSKLYFIQTEGNFLQILIIVP